MIGLHEVDMQALQRKQEDLYDSCPVLQLLFNWQVQSRAMTFQLGGRHDDYNVVALIPVIDLANHSFTPTAFAGPSRNGQRLQLQPLRALKAGEAVTISYIAEANNDDLMRDYGFVVPGNPFTAVALPKIDEVGAGCLASTALNYWFSVQCTVLKY
jgi:hypothetical protein